MEEQKNLKQIPIGTIEKQKLKPTTVKIVKTNIEFVEKAKNNKVVCSVKHPDSDDEINISTVKIEVNNQTKFVGTWVSLDKEQNLDMNSATAVLLKHLGCANIEALEGRECMTVEDDKGYLCFKAY